jgi:hypothetical protein
MERKVDVREMDDVIKMVAKKIDSETVNELLHI